MPALSALNMRLRDDFVADCNAGVGRWNRMIEKAGVPFTMKLPHVAFHRHIGEFAEVHADTEGRICSAMRSGPGASGEFLPSASDRAYIESLMLPVAETGQFAPWIAPPKVGIDNKPGNFEYVKIA